MVPSRFRPAARSKAPAVRRTTAFGRSCLGFVAALDWPFASPVCRLLPSVKVLARAICQPVAAAAVVAVELELGPLDDAVEAENTFQDGLQLINKLYE